MKLDPVQLDRLLWLLGKHLVDGIDAGEEAEMRSLVAVWYPEDARRLDLRQLTNLGLGITAAEKLGPLIREALEAEA